MRISDWSSDVCSSDLLAVVRLGIPDRFQQVENEPRIIEDLVVDGPVIGRALQQESRSGIFQDDLPRTAEQGQVVHRLQHDAERAARSEEHTSELQSLMRNSYAVFCLKKKNYTNQNTYHS